MSARTALVMASVLMFVAVAAGAFGAHALRQRLPPDLLDVWRTAVQYHAWHALGLALVGVLMLQWPARAALAGAGWCFVAGVVVFSGSLYALALTGVRGLGAITPLGGLAFLAGWLLLAFAVAR